MTAAWNKNEPRCVPRERTRTKTLKRLKLSAKLNSEVNNEEDMLPFIPNSGVKRIENLIANADHTPTININNTPKFNDLCRTQESLTQALTSDSSIPLTAYQMGQFTSTENRTISNKISNCVDLASVNKQCAMLASKVDQHQQVLGKLIATIAQKQMIKRGAPAPVDRQPMPGTSGQSSNILVTKMRWKPMAKSSRQCFPPLVTTPLVGPRSLEGQSFQLNATSTVCVAGVKAKK